MYIWIFKLTLWNSFETKILHCELSLKIFPNAKLTESSGSAPYDFLKNSCTLFPKFQM
jgi:hypothetical protein